MLDGFLISFCMMIAIPAALQHGLAIVPSRSAHKTTTAFVEGVGYGLFALIVLLLAGSLPPVLSGFLSAAAVLTAALYSSLPAAGVAAVMLAAGFLYRDGITPTAFAEAAASLLLAGLGTWSRGWRMRVLFRNTIMITLTLAMLLAADLLPGGFPDFVLWEWLPVAAAFLIGSTLSLYTVSVSKRYPSINGIRMPVPASVEERLRLVEQSPDPILVHTESIIVFANEACLRAFGAVEPEQVIGHNVLDFVHPDSKSLIVQQHKSLYESGGTMQPSERRLIRLSGDSFIVESSASLVSYKGRASIQVVFHDITERKAEHYRLQEANEQLSRLSRLDGLTGIANRRHFDEQLEREWKRCARQTKPLSLILFDIDHFKLYNDTYGHLAGDKCLRDIAAALDAMGKRPGDFFARYGGEEFALLLPETELPGALKVAEKVRRQIESLYIPHAVSALTGCVTVSLGIATMTCDLQTEQSELIRSADIALYRAKEKGRNTQIAF